MSYKRFNRYVIDYFGCMHDYYIAEFYPNSNSLVMVGSSPGSEHAQLENLALGMDEMDVVNLEKLWFIEQLVLKRLKI